VATRAERAALEHPHWVSSLALTADGKTLAAGLAVWFEDGKKLAAHSGEIWLWDVASVDGHRRGK
jgi:hypothetical protein